jgi:hypothetical protein
MIRTCGEVAKGATVIGFMDYGDNARLGQGPAILPQIAKSLYYKGLLVLMRRDRIIDLREKNLMIRIGEILGFDKRFCKATIGELLSNPNITREPILFSDERIKKCFCRDAARLAMVDGSFHPTELRWLRKVARVNGLKDQWLDAVIQNAQENKTAQGSAPLEIQKLL